MRKRAVRPPKIRLHFKNLMTSLSMKSKFLMLHRSENRHSRVKNQKAFVNTKRIQYYKAFVKTILRIDNELKEENETKEIQDEEYFYVQIVAV